MYIFSIQQDLKENRCSIEDSVPTPTPPEKQAKKKKSSCLRKQLLCLDLGPHPHIHWVLGKMFTLLKPRAVFWGVLQCLQSRALELSM
jgi:hypothetical protein